MLFDSEYVVIGAGAMGSAAAWQMARRGRDVVLLEQFDLMHIHGASHGQTRNFNPGYGERVYLDLILEARGLWRELETESGRTLLDPVGLANIGPRALNERLAEAAAAAGVETQWLSEGQAHERWPGFAIEVPVLFYPWGGRVRADEARLALHEATRRHGGTVLANTKVTAIEEEGDRVRIVTEGGEGRARGAVVAAGAWSRKLLGSLLSLPPLRVTQEQPAHFPLLEPVDETRWPSFNHLPNDTPEYQGWLSNVYGLISPGEGLKVGWHGVGPVTDPDLRSYQPDAGQMQALQQYVRRWIPGVDWQRPDPISCTYTTTADENFILDRRGAITVAAGFSGHGYKFTTAVGRILADLAVDNRPAPDIFRLGPDRPSRYRR